jgi:hypothetical protein
MGDCQCATIKQLESTGFIHYDVRQFYCSSSANRLTGGMTGIIVVSNRSITPRPSHALQIRFEIQSYTFSSLKVEQLKITGEAYKPYKGVRGRAIGNVEWRW